MCAFSAKQAVRNAKHCSVVIRGGFDHFTVKRGFSGSQRPAVFVTQLCIANMVAVGPDAPPFALAHRVFDTTKECVVVHLPNVAQVVRGDR